MLKGNVLLDIIIPVYNEDKNIEAVLSTLKLNVNTPFRVQICYDNDEDTTLPVVKSFNTEGKFEVQLTKNMSNGPHSAIITGFKNIIGEAAVVFPADDTYNAIILDDMYKKFKEGKELVVASRFIKGGSMEGCPFFKSFLVRAASFTLNWFALIPVKDASNGFRLFSKNLLETIEIESTQGFTYSLELLVKCHRYGWEIGEVPSKWFERNEGMSNFKILKWLPHYLRWYFYGFSTTYLFKSKSSVRIKKMYN